MFTNHRNNWTELYHYLWKVNPKYYQHSATCIADNLLLHQSLRKITKYSRNAINILDCGCGDGTLINLIARPGQQIVGVDVSELALSLAKKKIPSHKMVKLCRSKIEKLPFTENSFDLCYSTYVFEHLNNPQKAIDEMIRVCRPGGYLIFVFPNFGSPVWNAPSRYGILTIYRRSVVKFVISLWCLFFSTKFLFWLANKPLFDNRRPFSSDQDALWEPYLGSLLAFLKTKPLKVIEYDSGWQERKVIPRPNPMSRFFFHNLRRVSYFLGTKGYRPFNLYGPTGLVVCRKLKGD
jgi:ubiquinone/menaquinone biosynthesis C-methylase UbiE